MNQIQPQSFWMGAHLSLCLVSASLAPFTTPWLLVTAACSGLLVYANYRALVA